MKNVKMILLRKCEFNGQSAFRKGVKIKYTKGALEIYEKINNRKASSRLYSNTEYNYAARII